MDLIESALRRLQDSVSRLIAPSLALQDVRFLKTQIELRGLALRDIEAIRSGLRPFAGRQIGRHCRRQRHRYSCQVRVSSGHV
jgi:hypothetical protein